MGKPKGLILDDLEVEGDPGPFVVTLGGKQYELLNPQGMDYRELLAFMEEFKNGTPIGAVRVMVQPDDREAFFANRLPPFKLEALANGYVEHFNLGDLGEADASPPS